MSNPKSRTIPDTLSIYLVMLLIYCVDIFFFRSDLTVLGDAFYSRAVSMALLFVYLFVTKTSFSTLGITKKKKKFITGIVYGIIFSAIPLLIAMAAECFIFGLSDISSIQLRFTPPSLSHVRDFAHLTPLIAIIIYVFTTFFSSVFKEFFFRGYLLKKFKKVLSFRQANLLQAALYMFMTMPMLLRNLVQHFYDDTTASLGVFIIMFYVIHETIAGIKWGLLTRVTGSTYVAIVDHFLYVFLSNSVFITNRYVNWSFMLHTLAIQIISLCFVTVYYKINMKKLEEKRAREKAERETKQKEHAERRRERELNNIVDEKIQEINEISPDQYKNIVDETNRNRPSRHRHHSAEKVLKKNEANSKKNEELIEQVSTADAAKKANEYLENKMSSSHHHHHHHSSHPDDSDKLESFSGDISTHHRTEGEHHHHHHHHSDEAAAAANSSKLESFSADEVSVKTSAYSDSLSLERKTPKHPHPHDKMAFDSMLSAEELEKANSDKMDSYGENAIDDFLKSFSEDLSKEHRHHHRRQQNPEPEAADDNIDEITENFSADTFLKNFSEQRESSRQSHSSHHHHHHHSSSHHYRDEEEVVSMNEVSADSFFEEYQKTVEEKKEKKKQSFIRRVKELGLIDDSDSNDLI